MFQFSSQFFYLAQKMSTSSVVASPVLGTARNADQLEMMADKYDTLGVTIANELAESRV